MSDRSRVREAQGGELPNWSPRQPERIEDLKRAQQSRPGRWAPWERDLVFLIEFYETRSDPSSIRDAVGHEATTAELLAALSESPDVVCGECEGKGEHQFHSKSGTTTATCPACGGSGLNPKIVEAMANAYRTTGSFAAALRAFLSGGWTEGSDGS